jgi:hypothetical protein
MEEEEEEEVVQEWEVQEVFQVQRLWVIMVEGVVVQHIIKPALLYSAATTRQE